MKDYLKKIITNKRNHIANLEKAIIESDSKEERVRLGETLTKIKAELDEAETMLAKAGSDEADKKDEGKDGNKDTGDDKGVNNMRMNILGTYALGSGSADNLETRQKSINDELEKRGKALREKRAVTISSKTLILPKHTGEQLNDTFTPVSTLIDRVAVENLPGGESYEEAYVKSYKTGGITDEGADYTEAEPEFGYAPINKIKITAYAEISEEVKKLPNIDYARKVQEACEIALKKKISEQILNGTGTKQLSGIFSNTVAIDSKKDVEIQTIDANTLNAAIFNYGGDEDVETQAALIINKKTLKELSEVRKENGDPAYNIDLIKKTINTIPFIINSNVKDFATATNGEYIATYGDLNAYKTATFSTVDIMESTDFKFKQGMICFKASLFIGGNVIKQDGFLRLKKKI